jgi:hypothetical protein
MRIIYQLSGILIAVVLTGTGGCRSTPPPPTEQALPALAHYRQPNSGVDVEAFVLLRSPSDVDAPRSPESLQKLARRVVAGTGVDLVSQSMLIFTMGERSTHGYWCQVRSTSVKGDRLYVDIVRHRPGPRDRPTPGKQTPYCAVAMPRVSEQVKWIAYNLIEDGNPSARRKSGTWKLTD